MTETRHQKMRSTPDATGHAEPTEGQAKDEDRLEHAKSS